MTSGRRNVPFDFNPALASLETQLIESRGEELILRFIVPHTATQGNGVVSGGALASMLDMAMAMVVLSRSKPGFTCATISLTVNMQTAGEEGHFVAVAGVDRMGRQIAFAHAKLFDAQGTRVIANATSSLALIPVRP